MKIHKYRIAAGLLILLAGGVAIHAQTTEFNYQGTLKDNAAPANANYDFEFALFDALSGGAQVGATLTKNGVLVTNGVFAVKLDFGNQFPGANRYLEIRVKLSGQPNLTPLTPRQLVNSAPYSVKTLVADIATNATNATTAVTATNALSLGGVTANQYVLTGDARLSDSRMPAAGSSNYIQNTTLSQAGGNFNISGDGIVGNTLGIGVTPLPGAKLDVNGITVIRTTGSGGNIQLGSPNGESGMSVIGTNRADIRFDGTTLKLFAGPFANPPVNGISVSTTGGATVIGTNGDGSVITARRATGDAYINIDSSTIGQNSVLAFRKNNLNRWLVFADSTAESGIVSQGSDFRIDAYSNGGFGLANRLFISRSTGNVGLDTTTPNTRLALNGGNTWTSNGWVGAISTQNGSAIGWEANGSGQRAGIGHSSGGLFFFRTNSAFGTTTSPANYDMTITDNGNVTQPLTSNGLVKAMALIRMVRLGTFPETSSATMVNCYNSVTDSTSGNCGFTLSNVLINAVSINFGFAVNSRFISLTPGVGSSGTSINTFIGTSALQVINNNGTTTSEFYIFVY